MKNYKLKNDSVNDSQLQRICNYPLKPRDSTIHSDRGFVTIDDGS